MIPSSTHYPASEHNALTQLSDLFRDWYLHVETHAPELASEIVFDGFYPYYFQQKKRILFIGREPRHLKGHQYIETLLRAYVVDKKVGEKSLNQAKFHHLMFYVTYGILHDFPKYQDIPYADKLIDTFASEDGWSFAFMNLSKISNDTEDWTTNWEDASAFIEASTSHQNYFAQQIDILNPDIIITMNLGEKVHHLGNLTEKSKNHNINHWNYKLGTKIIPLLDAWHFSAPSKSPLNDFYTPITEEFKSSLK